MKSHKQILLELEHLENFRPQLPRPVPEVTSKEWQDFRLALESWCESKRRLETQLVMVTTSFVELIPGPKGFQRKRKVA